MLPGRPTGVHLPVKVGRPVSRSIRKYVMLSLRQLQINRKLAVGSIAN